MGAAVQQNYHAHQVLACLLSSLIDDKLDLLLDFLLVNFSKGPKEHQINMLAGLKSLIDNYIDDDVRVQGFLMPRLPTFVDFFIRSKGSRGIRVSIYESIFKPKKLANFVKALVKVH